MRRMICALLTLVLLVSAGTALAEKFNTKLFASGKEALNLASYGEAKKALKKLGMATDEESVQAFEQFLDEEFGDCLSVVQTEVAVAYAYGKNGGYRVAIPLEAPDYDDTLTLVLKSRDGQSYSGYAATSWADVQKQLKDSASVTWKDVYDPGETVILADD